MSDHFASWCDAYADYLEEMYNIMNEYKEKHAVITKADFAQFVYNNSSQYISPYI